MTWQHKRPTKKGYYWFRLDDSENPEIVEFLPACPARHARARYCSIGSDVACVPEPHNWWWPVALVAPKHGKK